MTWFVRAGFLSRPLTTDYDHDFLLLLATWRNGRLDRANDDEIPGPTIHTTD